MGKIGLLYRVAILLKLSDYNTFILAKMCLKAYYEKTDRDLRVLIDIDSY